MRKILLQLLLLVFSASAFAQQAREVAFGSGIVNYIGDLANEKYFPFSSANAGMQLTVRDFLNNSAGVATENKPLTLDLRFSWHRLQYDETQPLNGKNGMQLRNYLRGLSFRNDLFGTMVNFTYTFYTDRYRPLYKQKFAFFLFAGIGAFYGVPKADLFRGNVDLKNRYYFWDDGTIHDVSQFSGGQGNIIQKDGVYETNLHDWHTEGQGNSPEGKGRAQYHLVNAGFPFGGGVRYGFNRAVTLSLEFNYYFFFTDYLDDASSRYATYSELAASFPDKSKFEIAKYISDPTGRGTNGYLGPITSPRGNPGLKDSFTFINLEVAYKLTLKKRALYGQTAMY